MYLYAGADDGLLMWTQDGGRKPGRNITIPNLPDGMVTNLRFLPDFCNVLCGSFWYEYYDFTTPHILNRLIWKSWLDCQWYRVRSLMWWSEKIQTKEFWFYAELKRDYMFFNGGKFWEKFKQNLPMYDWQIWWFRTMIWSWQLKVSILGDGGFEFRFIWLINAKKFRFYVSQLSSRSVIMAVRTQHRNRTESLRRVFPSFIFENESIRWNWTAEILMHWKTLRTLSTNKRPSRIRSKRNRTNRLHWDLALTDYSTSWREFSRELGCPANSSVPGKYSVNEVWEIKRYQGIGVKPIEIGSNPHSGWCTKPVRCLDANPKSIGQTGHMLMNLLTSGAVKDMPSRVSKEDHADWTPRPDEVVSVNRCVEAKLISLIQKTFSGCDQFPEYSWMGDSAHS